MIKIRLADYSRCSFQGIKIVILIVFMLAASLILNEDKIKATGENPLQATGLSKEDALLRFTEAIYDHYSRQDFEYVYQSLHPAIRQSLSEEEYRKFQEKNFRRYGVEISNVQIESWAKVEKIPEKFLDYIEDTEHNFIYSAAISYQLKFNSNGVEQEKIVEKEVFICSKNDRQYLLWDPSIIDKG